MTIKLQEQNDGVHKWALKSFMPLYHHGLLFFSFLYFFNNFETNLIK